MESISDDVFIASLTGEQEEEEGLSIKEEVIRFGGNGECVRHRCCLYRRKPH